MSEILLVDDIHTYYGEAYVLQGLSLKVEAGSVAALIGRNGMGKTTTMRSIIGFNAPRQGKIYFKGKQISGLPPYRICQEGLSLVPQGRRVFSSLTTRENLDIAARNVKEEGAWDMEKVFSFFPRLRERASSRGNQLSGGEKQMLAIARALIFNAELMLMDEPSEGLAPLIIREVGNIILQLKEGGFSILLAEQNLPLVLNVADYVYVINKGRVVFEGTPKEIQSNEEVKREYLAI